MANLYSCDWDADGSYAYRERIALSDGTIVCCESGVKIPEGFPYADCRPRWFDCDHKDYMEDPNALPTAELLPFLDLKPQCMEVWRLLRNDSQNRGTCPAWGNAVQDYLDTDGDNGENADRFALLKLNSVIQRAWTRYKEGKQPRLHPWEKESLESGQFVEALSFSFKHKKKETAE